MSDASSGSAAPVPAMLAAKTPLIMGIVNVTPDSFSDGGAYDRPAAAVRHAHQLIAEGADCIDIGGESTRPGAAPVDPDTEQARVLPVIAALQGAGALVSCDTRNAATMRAAINAGAELINDVSALTYDPSSMDVIAGSDASVVLMHARGTPQTMQDNPRYGDVVAEVTDYLGARIEACTQAGIGKDRVIVDPGIGFGKRVEHNLELIRQLAGLRKLGCPVLVGVSRKNFIGVLSGVEAPHERLAGSLSAALACIRQGADIVRVHDVAETGQAIKIWRAIEA